VLLVPSPVLKKPLLYAVTVERQGWREVVVRVGTHRKPASGKLRLQVLTAEHAPLRDTSVDLDGFADNSYATFRFEPIANSGGRDFLLRFEVEDPSGQTEVSLFEEGRHRGRLSRFTHKPRTGLHLRATRRLPAPAEEPAPPTGIPTEEEYAAWIAETEPGAAELEAQRSAAASHPYQPLISVILPVHRVPCPVLGQTLASVQAQTYGKWEICASHDAPDAADVRQLLQTAAAADRRIKLVLQDGALGISENSNRCLALASGDYIALLDHDDVLAPFAFHEMVVALNEDREADFLYSDKDMLPQDGSRRYNPLFKPRFDPKMLLSANYLTHLNLIRTKLVREVGGWHREMDGAQDWDLFLRICERTTRIRHVARVLYHWRVVPTSVASGVEAKPYALEAQLRALNAHLRRKQADATVVRVQTFHYRVRWSLGAATRVACVLDARAAPERISAAVDELLAEGRRGELQIATCAVLPSDLPAPPSARLTAVLAAPSDGYPAGQIETWLREQRADAVLFLDAELIPAEPGWLRELVQWVIADREVGFASPLVLDEAEKIHDAGWIPPKDGAGALPLFRGLPKESFGLFGAPSWYRSLTAASPAALAVGGRWLREAGIPPVSDKENCFLDLAKRITAPGGRGIHVPFARLKRPDGTRSGPRKPWSADPDDPTFHPRLRTDSPVPTLLLRRTVARNASRVDRYAEEARVLARHYDFSRADLRGFEQDPTPLGRGYTVNWYLPTFLTPHVGGVATVFRSADHLARTRDVRSRFLIYGLHDAGAVARQIAQAFPSLSGSEVVAGTRDGDHAARFADCSVATLWTTAFELLKAKNTRRKYYFIQDYEPLFYPAGSSSALAEATYRFGFYGICNTVTVRELYASRYGGTAMHFAPAIDPAVFHTRGRAPRRPPRIFLYARPENPRNAFELIAEAARRLKMRRGDGVDLVTAGAEWQPAGHDLHGVVRNLGLLPYAQTGDLYRSCHAGVAFMLTPHPSYLPLELMACGALAIANVNPGTAWLLRDGENCRTTQATASCLTETVEEVLDGYDELAPVRERALATVQSAHCDWSIPLERIARFLDEPIAHAETCP
jgi:glycosyltransferase involved in cell wall biosynthesis/GT2 family glycosyltransferase